ncbi:MAG TPA: SusD/RagB family nutrient-binding outer membrane lipoprotein [Sphingobacteriaceae bacterium]
MNKILKKIAIVAVGAMFLHSGCQDYFDLTDNPNLVSDPPLNSFLATATHKTGLNNQRVANITSYFVQYLANPGAGASTDTYQITDYTGTWDNLYYAMADIYDMKQKAIAEGASDYHGVANILMSYHLTLVSDLWGSAPYSDAFTGETLTPAYDTEEELYNEAIRLLDEGIAELNKTGSVVSLRPADDFIHGGNKAQWIRTAYALKARLLNKISKKPEYDAANVLAAVGNSYTSNADDAVMGAFQIRNPWADIALDNTQLLLGGWLSEQFVEHLNGTSYGVFDPRIRKITDPTFLENDPAFPPYVGTVNGAGNRENPPYNNTDTDENYISRNSPWTADDAPIFIVTFAEVKFIEAEAALRAGDLPRAYTAYLAGIAANMDKLEVPAAERDAYLANPAVAVGAANLTLDHIFKEKYVSTYLNPEAWNDARRYDYQYANFGLPVNSALNTFIRRVAYPVGETSKNGVNVPAPVSLDTRLWWDQP